MSDRPSRISVRRAIPVAQIELGQSNQLLLVLDSLVRQVTREVAGQAVDKRIVYITYEETLCAPIESEPAATS